MGIEMIEVDQEPVMFLVLSCGIMTKYPEAVSARWWGWNHVTDSREAVLRHLPKCKQSLNQRNSSAERGLTGSQLEQFDADSHKGFDLKI